MSREGSSIDICGARLPRKPVDSLWDVSVEHGRVASVEPHVGRDHTSESVNANGRLLAPSLCHAHIHLDKCFLLQDPKYSDLQIVRGDFAEAMELTGTAKSRFSEQDLLRRGRQLIRESINHGVTAMRAFVEIDNVVEYKCLHAAAILKTEFMDRCHVQICAFAQLPLFTGPDNGLRNRELMEEAAGKGHVDVVGSTPYVEESREKALNNLKWISKIAKTNKKHLDLHLDYSLDPNQEPLVHQAVEEGLMMEEQEEDEGPRKLTLGHCTRLTLFSDQDWHSMSAKLRRKSAVSFVGLPTSDLFMMRTESGVRGTLPVIKMIEDLGLNTAIAVNNVGNAFTPQGSCDPLSVASLGVAVYQAATKKNTETLFECVSTRAKAAIGLETTTLEFNVGEHADFVLFDNAGWRARRSISEAVYDPNCSRQTIYNGRLLVYQDVSEDLDTQ